MDKNRTYIIPSLPGLFYLGLNFLFFFAALTEKNTIGYVLVTLMMAFFLISMVQTNNNLKEIRLVQISTLPVCAGSICEIAFTFASPNESYQIFFNQNFIVPLGSSQFKVLVPELHRWQTVNIPLTSQARGMFPLPKIRLSSRFPVGLFFSWKIFQPEVSCLFYPKPEGDLPLPQEGNEALKKKGEIGHKNTLGEVDFYQHHPHVYGNSPRHIDWKVYARSGELLTKEFTDGTQYKHLNLIWDALPLEKELRISQISQWIRECEKNSIPYSLHLPTETLNHIPSKSHYHTCMKALALL